MKVEDIKKIGIVGSGLMGHGVALSFALWGYEVMMCDIKNEVLQTALKHIERVLDTFIGESLIDHEQAKETLKRISITTDLNMLGRNADYICECIIEASKDKKDLFNKLDKICPVHTILASNTSSLVLSDFASEVKRQDKVVVTHYFNPPYIVPCVEVVKGPKTSEETYEITYKLLERVKKRPVKVLKELPGYLVNRIQSAMYREAFDLWAKGVASPEDIDRAVKDSLGFRLASVGPLLTSDLAGFYKAGPRAPATFNVLQEEISRSQAIPEQLAERWKNYRGIYDYSQEELNQIIEKRDREFIRRFKESYQ